ncbi:hypothetical protein [Pseudoalteromonas sp.]|uniref:hypothetical protein n=1 Tax=Pseudoalteromonas sp. TaxID=53249 RepID=UPI0023556610|nr:hypothetical protein [Pseudoalteromonas sp.]
MIELYLLGGAGAVVFFLWWRNGVLKAQAERQKIRAEVAEKVADHNEKVATVARERNDSQPERIEEIVDNAIDNDFSDFYSDDDT